MKVVIPQEITEAGKDYLRERGYEVVMGRGGYDQALLKEDIADADAIIARTCPYPAEVLAAAKKLKVIGRYGVGIDNIDMDWCTANGVKVCITPNANSVSVAEHAVGLMLACAHHIPYFDRNVRNQVWGVRDTCRSFELTGKTVGIIGMGHIGGHVAEMCIRGFGMKAIGYARSLPADRYPAGCVKAESMEQVLREADFVSLHIPSTPATRNFINKETLALMKPGAFLINTARGDVVNTEDLVACLKANGIAGYGTDVYATEPPTAENCPLLDLDNVVMTPHCAALTQEAMDRMGLMAAADIDAVLNGREPAHPIN
ncbi:hydroxyacid dehydrogenase [Dysosmobacter sp.]|uniref:hydroxyacid dehydrogenase n=1 Tax=Dysosmobacter sp. TaxID=2591382 RepID=UPI002A902059|nr:hydroxyacid dehydrogenase [Dysosmobacter sp.]MDY3280919.1 hydroxyacid dehydrogenase [Dysosmobacter sp.]